MTHYDIYLENKPIGIACVESLGLYTQFRCRCNFLVKGPYRIIAQYGTLQIDLGLCIPQDNIFVTSRKVATKKLNKETPCFFAVYTKQLEKRFIPVDSQEKFAYIARLAKAKFCIQKDIRGIMINNDYGDSAGVISSK